MRMILSVTIAVMYTNISNLRLEYLELTPIVPSNHGISSTKRWEHHQEINQKLPYFPRLYEWVEFPIPRLLLIYTTMILLINQLISD